MTILANKPELGLEDTIVTDTYTIGSLCVPNTEGDTRLMWDSRVDDEVEAAEGMFDDLRAKGFAVYKAKKNGAAKGEVITEFDSLAERLVAIKPLVGG